MMDILDTAIVSKKEEGPKTVSLSQVRLPYDEGYIKPEIKSEPVNEAPQRGRPKKNAESDKSIQEK